MPSTKHIAERLYSLDPSSRCGIPARLDMQSNSPPGRRPTPNPSQEGYVFSVPLIAGCPGLVPGWHAFPAINRVPLPTPPPVLSPLSPGTPGLRGERTGGGMRGGNRVL